MENGLTRATTIAALTCLLVAGAAATSILARNAQPEPQLAAAPPELQEPVSNKAAKNDRLPVAATLALAAFEPRPPAAEPTQSLRLAFASTTASIEPPKPATAAAPVDVPEAAKPKLVTRPSPQKPYALLSDAQIATIKERLRLSPEQESYWPAVETALHAVARKIHATRQAAPHSTGAPIDPDSEEVQQLKSAAMPLLFQLREDQKREVRTLARLIGLEKVASLI
jgi:murein DD-endopeptidase MepM/ murein hydrolase activator NlpD